MQPARHVEVYSPREIADAAGVSEQAVIEVLGAPDVFVPHDDAVRLGRELVSGRVPLAPPELFAQIVSVPPVEQQGRRVPLAISSTVHAGVIALAVFLASLSQSPSASAHATLAPASNAMRVVWLATPGPGGGGGGGGRRERPPPRAERSGSRALSSPLPERRPVQPLPSQPAVEPEPPPLAAEPLPAIVAPVVAAPADARERAGVVEDVERTEESRGPGIGGGTGTATGTGVGSGDGPGVGPGTGGGTGGGPYRPGSGIEPPRLLHEVKADYTEDARRRGVEGDVVLEIVVRSDGTVGDVRLLRRLGAGLDQQAIEAVRRWRFSPARRQGTPVDVVVEVAVEFKLR